MSDARPHLVNVSFKVQYKCAYGQSMKLVGNAAFLGHWRPSHGQRMHWGRDDFWSCAVAVPAGTSLECKYVIVDEEGMEVRWQEGGNMAVRVPTAVHGLPVESYDVAVSWCKTSSSFTARPLTTLADAAVASIATRAAAAAAAAGAADAPTAAAPLPAAAYSSASAGSTTVAAAEAATSSITTTAAPLTAWARARGGTDPRPFVPPRAGVQAASHAMAVAEPVMAVASSIPAVAFTALRSCQPAAQVLPAKSPAAPASAVSVGAGSGSSNGGSGSSLVDMLVQAVSRVTGGAAAGGASSGSSPRLLLAAATATSAEAPTTHSAALDSSPSPAAAAPAGFQLTPASEDEPMSIVLPARRASSPPYKISLSSNFSKLMEMPSMGRSSSGCAVGGGGGSPSGSPRSSTGGAAPAAGAMHTATPASFAAPASDTPGSSSMIQSHPVAVNTSPVAAIRAPTASTADCNPGPSSGTATSTGAAGPSGRAPAPTPASPPRSPTLASLSASSLVWGHEYDVYAAAYDTPYMHTPFDLDAYAVYDQMPCPMSACTASRAAPGSGASNGVVAQAALTSADMLENAVQAARNNDRAPSPKSTVTAPAAPSAAGAAVVSASQPGKPAASASAASLRPLLSPELLTATAASTALALANMASAATATSPTPPSAASLQSRSPAANAPAAAAVPAAATAAPPPPMSGLYREVAVSSASVGDWASRTLMEMSSGRAFEEEGVDDVDTADEDAAVAQALRPPSAPADMKALLTDLGTALGRSVRLRYDGAEPGAADLLELDRMIAMAASKLYRSRDTLLTGWVRKETRRQLAMAPAATVGGSRPASSSVTPM